MRLMFYAFRWTLLIILARWDYVWRYNIDIALSSYMELRPLIFMTCLCSKVHCSLFTLLGLLTTLNFVCVWYVFYSALTVIEMIIQSRLNLTTFCSKIHILDLAKSLCFNSINQPLYTSDLTVCVIYQHVQHPKILLCPRIVYSCVVWISEQKAIVTP